MANPRTTEKKCKLIDVKDFFVMEFQMMPDGITDSKQVNWNHIEIVGRSSPILGYSSSGARTLNLNLTFFANPSIDDPTTTADVQANLKFLMSLTYPDYSGGSILPPHLCWLTLNNFVNMFCVVSDVNLNYKGLSLEGQWPVYAEASVTLIEAPSTPINYTVIRG